MAKFNIGDQVRVVSGGWSQAGARKGDCNEVRRVPGGPNRCYGLPDATGYLWSFHENELELVSPAEHPALTLAKAEVVRLKSRDGHSPVSMVMLGAYTGILRAFGLEYRAKPVVPQPVEYEFVAVSQ